MTLDQIKKLIDKHQIEKIKVGGPDLDAVFRGKFLSVDKFLKIAKGEGFGFCDLMFGWDMQDITYTKCDFTGWHTGFPDLRAKPDLSTFRLVPWQDRTASVLIDYYDRETGKPIPMSPRLLLQSVVRKARKMGYEPYFAMELEFFVFNETPRTIREKRYRDLIPFDEGPHCYNLMRWGEGEDFLNDVWRNIEAYGIPIEAGHTELGPGMFEIALKYAPALEMADRVFLYKNAVKELARRHGLVATFMAKWNPKESGNSGHIHQSLVDLKSGQNAFYDAKDKLGMSAVMRRYIAGQLATMPDLMVMMAPTINSYRRSVENSFVSTTLTWSVENRTVGLRAIPDAGAACRIEHRLAGADANPYLAFAANLAGGLHGLESKLPLGPPYVGNAYAAPEGTVETLPRDLAASTARFENSKVAKKLFGGQFVHHYAQTRWHEVNLFRKAVTDWELERYFEII